jgi:beta-N-acetylhexosaminidase
MKRHRYLLPLLFLFTLVASLDANALQPPETDTLQGGRVRWVDSVYLSLDTNQRIAQLLVIRAWSTKDSSYNDSLTRVISGLNVGGVCFFRGTPCSQARLTNLWHDSIRTPLLVAIDAEWGMGMRLDSAFDFPYQMTLGAIREDSLIYRMSSQIARDCRRMGVHVNFAPVVDINNNPANPVINLRSFGEDPGNVTRKGILYMKGLQDHGVLSTGKHFPGHGDTDTDSHLSLPLISHSQERLDSVELEPFKALIRGGVRGMMIAHLYVPAFETIPGLPSTLSNSIVTSLLKERLGFRGFVITDALDMQGVTKYFPSGQIEVKALQAGNDILLLPQDAHQAVKTIREAADSGLVSWQLVEAKCKAILELKYDLGLAHEGPVSLRHLTADLNPRESFLLNETLFRSSVTLLKNDYRLLPLILLDRRRVACVSAGDTVPTEFQEMLSNYLPCANFIVRHEAKKPDLDSLLTQLKGYDLVLLGVHHANLYPKDHYGMTDAILSFLDKVPQQNRAVLALFGNPYILDILKDPDAFGAIVTTYQDRPEAEEAAAEMIAGGLGAQGLLPVSAGGFKAGTGLATEPARIGFTPPETFGITPEMLTKADSMAADGIASGAYPGCQVLFAKDGKIFYYKAFGHPGYNDTIRVTTRDLYDLASVTKMAGTTLAVMKLYEEGRIRLDEPIGDYLPLLRNTSKGDLTIREIMSHQAGLQAWIPFYQSTLTNGLPDTAVYSSHPSPEFPVRVAPGLYIRTDYRDTILQQIIRSDPGKRGEYNYSDLGFYLLDAMATHLTGKPLDQFLDTTFYRPLGLTTMGYRPLLRFPSDRIMPTENDTVWRHALLRGDVHDPGAAMLGGVAGHAGLFSDAFDLAVILQMLLNYGEYGGKQYLLPSTVREFTGIQYPSAGNRRGLGFDKPPPVYLPDGPSCRSASPSSFGHSGFTGTYAWADPENKLIYIFLSNRVCPDASNNKLSQKNIRTDLHQVIYDLLDAVSGK